MPYERTIEIAVTRDVIVQLCQSGRPIDRYAVILLALVGESWQTVRVYDNHLGTHHMHRYTRSGGKQAPEVFHDGGPNEAIPAAIAHLKRHWEAIIRSWTT